MDDRVALPGYRGAAGHLDTPSSSAEAVVVACPPHPQHGGTSSDPRVRSVADALVEREIACLRVDYGSWGEGTGEQTDIRHAVDWATRRFRSVGLFGYSFGAAVAILVGATRQLEALGILAPPSSFVDGSDIAGTLETVTCPVLVCHGTADTTVNSAPIVEMATESNRTVDAWPTGHHFSGYLSAVTTTLGDFFARTLA